MQSGSIAVRQDEEPGQAQGESTLVRTYRVVDADQLQLVSSEGLHEQWQGRWSDQRDRISRRLAAIDSQLSRLALERIPTDPKFAVVGVSGNQLS